MKIKVGLGSCGVASGGRKVMDKLTDELKKRQLDADLEPTGCIGMCYLEPLVDITEGDKTYSYGHVTPEMVGEILDAHQAGHPLEKYIVASPTNPYPFVEKYPRVALKNCGVINPEKIEDYLAAEGYQALKKVLTEMKPEDVIEEIKISGLRGRDGAGVPTWFKWNAARMAPGNIKYMVCNADEGDPGAFMDRSVLEGIPTGH